ncbi:MAG: LCP family protein [Patescibacteria group bacterium]|jgi:LCP family protein required for cell wall assembly
MIDFKQKIQELEPETRSSFDKDPNRSKKRKIRNYIIAIIVLALVFSWRILISSHNASNWFSDSKFFNRFFNFIPIAEKKLTGEAEDRVNILLLGVGGKSHEAGDLTDTIMLASLKPSTGQISLISFPRDLVSPFNGWQKINSINAYAEKKDKGSGGEEAAKIISQMLKLPIPYYLRVDFSGFETIIDELGGVEIDVERSFTDYTYPISGRENDPDYYSRFEVLSFTAGPTKMDGSLALKYARSRHALGPEGSDFARAKRQQLLLSAIKDKLLSHQILLSPATINRLINELNKNINTNLSPWELLRFWNLAKDTNRENIINLVFNDAPNNYLVADRGENGAYILLPRTGNFSEISNVVKNIFIDNEVVSPTPEKELVTQEKASLFVANGTWITGLAGKTAELAKDYNFKIVGTDNAIDRNYEQSVIYDLTNGKKNESLQALKKLTQATQAFNSPDWLDVYRTGEHQTDFLLIVGTEANK